RALGQRDRRRQEGIARFGEKAAVVGGELVERYGARIDQADAGGRLRGHRRALVADVVPGQPEARLAIVGLLGGYAVESDIAAAESRHAGAPALYAIAFAAHRR